MSFNISAALSEQLKPLQITSEEFSELLIRLLDYGIISREESQIEALLYDRYLHCSEVVEDYLSVLKVRILHDKKFNYIRVFPPASVVPGLVDSESMAFGGGFRTKPNQQEVAVILVLRVEYEKSLREGQLDDRGCVMISLEGLSFAFKNLLKRSLPESVAERKSIFKRLRQLRLIQMSADIDFESGDSWLRIQPAITSFVNQEAFAQLHPSADQPLEETAHRQKETDDVL